jgi:hypothetical protein
MDGWVVASSGCPSMHLVRVAYADLLHTSSVEDLNGGHGTPSGGLRAHRAGSGLVSWTLRSGMGPTWMA